MNQNPYATEIQEIGRRILTQDNRMTNLPMYVVQEKVKVYGFDPDIDDVKIAWTCSGDELSDEDQNELERIYRETGENKNEWEADRVGYVEQINDVQVFFTNDAAEAFIRDYGYNLNQPQIYVKSGYRNREWEVLREYLKWEAENVLEALWKEQKGVNPETGKMWLTPRQQREADKLAKTWTKQDAEEAKTQVVIDTHP